MDWRRPAGDPAIGPATAITYEATLQHLFSRAWALQASVFYREWYDEPGWGPMKRSCRRLAEEACKVMMAVQRLERGE